MNFHVLPLHKGRRAKRVLEKPLFRTSHKKFVKSIVWYGFLNLLDIGPREPESESTERKINEVTLSEKLYKRITLISVFANLMMHLDH